MSRKVLDAEATDLLIDIGGTNVRVAPMKNGQTGQVRRHRSASFRNVEQIVREYLNESGGITIRRIFLAVAGPVKDGRADLTNVNLTADTAALAKSFQLEDVAMFNDLEALAYSLKNPACLDVVPLINAKPAQGETSIVIVPGTGLGLAAYVQKGGKNAVISTQGGHVRVAPSTPLEFELCRYLLRNRNYLCAEDLLSGPGMKAIYTGLLVVSDQRFEDTPPECAVIDAKWIVTQAVEHNNKRAQETIDVYCSMLGSYCSDMAMIFLPYGGIYLGGNIINAFTPKLGAKKLVKSYLNKGLMSSLVQTMAFGYFRETEPVLAGLKAFAQQRSARD